MTERAEGQRSGLPKEANAVKRSGTEFVQIPPAPPFYAFKSHNH